MARGKNSIRGSGAEYLNTAISYILNVSDIIGGRIIYLDCEAELQQYYEKHEFTFLQKKKYGDLIQMYRVL